MELKNFKWNGFGFPVIFEVLPAIKIRGEVVPDLDFAEYAAPLVKFICSSQDFPLSGNQVRFIRHTLNMSLREFALFINVTHQSVMRWEQEKNASAKIGTNNEIVLRIRILQELKGGKESILDVTEKIENIKEFESSGKYKVFKPLKVPGGLITHLLQG